MAEETGKLRAINMFRQLLWADYAAVVSVEDLAVYSVDDIVSMQAACVSVYGRIHAAMMLKFQQTPGPTIEAALEAQSATEREIRELLARRDDE